MRVARSLAVALAVSALAACAMPTPFQPADARGYDGYSVQQIEKNRFRIAFNGNSLTSRGQVENTLTYLAAQVTLRNGDDYFVFAGAKTEKTTSYPTYLAPVGGGWGWYRHDWYGGGPGYETDFSHPSNAFDAAGDIVTYRGTKPADNPNAYDARDVATRLAPVMLRAGAAPGPY